MVDFVRTTQQESYALTRSYLGKTQQKVLQKIREIGPATRSEIAKATGMRTSSATARVKELLDLGEIEVVGIKFDEESRRNVELVKWKS